MSVTTLMAMGAIFIKNHIIIESQVFYAFQPVTHGGFCACKIAGIELEWCGFITNIQAS